MTFATRTSQIKLADDGSGSDDPRDALHGLFSADVRLDAVDDRSLPERTSESAPNGVMTLRTTAVAARLGLSLSRVRQLGDAGLVSLVRAPDGARLFDAADVERLRRARQAYQRARACRFCGRAIPQRAKVCQREWCRKARDRVRVQRFVARYRERTGEAYYSARQRQQRARRHTDEVLVDRVQSGSAIIPTTDTDMAVG